MSADISGLFRPFTIGPITLANRFVMPGMQRGFSEGGRPLPQLADYYRRRVEGGVSLVISESCAIAHESATAQPAASRLAPDTFDAWARCVGAVTDAGGHMLLQLWHEGGLRKDEDGLTLSASGYGHPGLQRGRAASPAELGEMIDGFVTSALLAQKAGAAGVEVHGAHGFMLDQFLWAATNQRADGYGGAAIADRVRLPAEIVAAIRAACGPDFLISFRFSQWKEHDYTARVAQTPDELGEMLAILREAGVDMLHASTRRFWTPEWPDHDWGLAGWTRHLSGLPTITVGSVGLDRDVMESFSTEGEARSTIETSLDELSRRLARGEFDLVSVGRSLISDPDWVKKVHDGDYAAIRPFQKRDIASLEWEG
ncbi:12-oxophytodienoate reductase [Sphingomonas sp. MMS24-J13]|uniref:oxidoreductase n=1 Tax=Sphingomonas sp. MMS24-J13 TaxID=3238686 RepID=UPI00384D720C